MDRSIDSLRRPPPVRIVSYGPVGWAAYAAGRWSCRCRRGEMRVICLFCPLFFSFLLYNSGGTVHMPVLSSFFFNPGGAVLYTELYIALHTAHWSESGAEDKLDQVVGIWGVRPLAGDDRLRSGRRVIAALAALFWKWTAPVRLWSN